MTFDSEKNLQPRKASRRTATQHQQLEGRCDGVSLQLGTAISLYKERGATETLQSMQHWK